MRTHKGETAMLSVRVPKALRDRFTASCHDHNTTTCQVLASMLEMWLRGVDQGLVNVGSNNPVTLQLNQYFLGRPRSSLRTLLESLPQIPARLPVCRLLAWVNFPRLDAYCRRRGDVVSLEFCLKCRESSGAFQVDLS